MMEKKMYEEANSRTSNIRGIICPDVAFDSANKALETNSSPPNSYISVNTRDETFPSSISTHESFDEHPYKHLLRNFEPTSDQLSFVDSLKPCKSLEETPLCEVNTQNDLEKLVNDLQQEKEIGVDVEYSSHGYEGVVCLIQISTKETDYIIDAIILKNHMHLLSRIFIDPKILKIFHGASNDLKWFQEDFRLFVINIFDTNKAMKALGYKTLSLSFLLQEFNITKSKNMQMADFRKRPLPQKYKDYARIDSHFLIYFYQKLKNELIQAKVLRQVLDESNEECRIVHKNKSQDVSYSSVRQYILKMHQHQLHVLKKLDEWRQKIAKEADLNVGYVLSKKDLRALAIELPSTPESIFEISKSPYVKRDIEEIIKIFPGATFQKPTPREADATPRRRQLNNRAFQKM